LTSAIGVPGMVRILIVDDDFFVLSAVRRVLQSDYEVKTASDGETALGIAQRFAPDFVFVDYVLDHENGLDVIRKLRGVSPESELILISGKIDRDFYEEITAVGGDGFLEKTDLPRIREYLSQALSCV
jgi:PleD family two-component response regulator